MWLTKRAGRSVDDFFVGRRQMTWWLLGISMAATNFSIDTPIAMTRLVVEDGIAGVWFFWASGISALLVTFLFARLWRRSGVMTDAEIIEERYSGRVAAVLRVFKGFYFGVIFNAFIMGWVFLALIKVMTGLTNIDVSTLLVGTTVLVFVYTLASGFYGVVLTDFVQYFIAFIGSIVLALFAVREVGGLGQLVSRVESQFGGDTLRFFPDFSVDNLGPLSIFFTYVLVQWWAHKYSDGGGKHIQRMLSAKNENHSFAASLLYSFINYALQVWPWILTALCGLVLFGRPEDPEQLYSMVMARVLPPGLLGLVLVGLIGAFMSTIDTHLNLGASYMVNDIYRRFLVRDASEKHYVLMSRVMMAGLLGLSILIALNIQSVTGAWKFLLTFASGAGLTWIIRWFWWRVNAWTELSAMISSGVVATYLQLRHEDWLYSEKLLVTVALSTLVWLLVTLVTAPVDGSKLKSFVEKIRPGSAGWNRIRDRSNEPGGNFLRRALGLWAIALVGLFSLNFGIGSLLLHRLGQAALLLSTAGVSMGWLAYRLKN
ncbi:MAG: sodium:solute symporter family protein [Thermoanaerobaculia bacterium]